MEPKIAITLTLEGLDAKRVLEALVQAITPRATLSITFGPVSEQTPSEPKGPHA